MRIVEGMRIVRARRDSRPKVENRWSRLATIRGWWLRALLLVGLWIGSMATARADMGPVQGWDVQSASASIQRGAIHFRYDPSLRDAAVELAAEAPSWWRELERELGQDVDDELTIHFVTHAGQVSAATGMPKWVSGVANGHRGEIAISYHNPDGSRSDLASLLRHEMAHVALRRATAGQSAPRWFHEGVADALGAEIDLGRAQTLAAAAFGVGIPPIESWDAALLGSGAEVSNAYAAARDFVSYLRYRDDDGRAFKRWIGNIHDGVPFAQATKVSFGEDLHTLQNEWRQSLRGRYFWYALLASGSLPMVLAGPLLGLAWRRKRRERADALRAMEKREQWERQRDAARAMQANLWRSEGFTGTQHIVH